MWGRRAVVLGALASALVVPVVAQAKLPAPAVKTVVFGKSVAGVKLGMSLAAAKAAWGPGSKCAAKKCTWSTTPNAQRDLGARLSFVLNKGKVVAIIVQDGTGGAKAGIKKFRTAKNIGIGSTSAAVRKAYPALGPFSGSVGFGNANLGSGKTVTNFQFVNDKLDAFQIGSPI